MATTSTNAALADSAPYPVAKLQRELRNMIYHHYFNLMNASTSQQSRTNYCPDGCRMRQPEDQISDFQTLKPYLSMLHLSSVVRSETVTTIYKAVLANPWFNFEVDSTCSDVERVKAMIAAISNANVDVEFGLHFEVSDCCRDVFLQFVESIRDVFGSNGELRADFDFRWEGSEKGRATDTANLDQKVGYVHESDYKDYHRLWVFGALAKYDWSSFDISLPSPARACRFDIPHLDSSYCQCQLVEDDEESGFGETDGGDDDDDNGLDGGNEVIVLVSDDEDDEDTALYRR